MLGHLGVNVRDLVRAKAYYDQLMPLLEFEPFLAAADQFAYRPAGGKPGTYVFFYPALAAGDYSRHRCGLQHLAFMVKTRAAVHAALGSSDKSQRRPPPCIPAGVPQDNPRSPREFLHSYRK